MKTTTNTTAKVASLVIRCVLAALSALGGCAGGAWLLFFADDDGEEG